MRLLLPKSKLFALSLLLSLLATTLPALAGGVPVTSRARPLSQMPMKGVSNLKAGLSNGIECGNNPTNCTDPSGLDRAFIGYSNYNIEAELNDVYNTMMLPFIKNGHTTNYPEISLTKQELLFGLSTSDLVYTMSHGAGEGLDLGENGTGADLFFTELYKWAQARYGDDRSSLAKIVIFSGCDTGSMNLAASALGAMSKTGGRAFGGWDVSVGNWNEGPFSRALLQSLAEGRSIGESKAFAVNYLKLNGNTRAANFADKHFQIFGDESTRLSW